MTGTTTPKRGKRKIAQEIARLTAGLGATAIDLVVLVGLFGGGAILFGPHAKDFYADRKWRNVFQFTEKMFSTYRSSRFRQALGRAAAAGLVERTSQGVYRLTDQGKKRLENLLPSFKRRQKWDGRLWLITYDVPEEKHRKRNVLREYLEEVGCRIVQESVWLSVKDPRQWITPKIDELRLRGKVIVSCVGRDGMLGEEDTEKMVYKLFAIRLLEKQYQRWIAAVERTPTGQRGKHFISYLGIFQNDPVLPLELLPSPWIGEIARRLFETIVLPTVPNWDSWLKNILY